MEKKAWHQVVMSLSYESPCLHSTLRVRDEGLCSGPPTWLLEDVSADSLDSPMFTHDTLL